VEEFNMSLVNMLETAVIVIGTVVGTIMGWGKWWVTRYMDKRAAQDMEVLRKDLEGDLHKRKLVATRLDSDVAAEVRKIMNAILDWKYGFLQVCAYPPPAHDVSGHTEVNFKQLGRYFDAYLESIGLASILFPVTTRLVLKRFLAFMNDVNAAYGVSLSAWYESGRNAAAVKIMFDERCKFVEKYFLPGVAFLESKLEKEFQQILGVSGGELSDEQQDALIASLHDGLPPLDVPKMLSHLEGLQRAATSSSAPCSAPPSDR
jgi:hypothetical protein